MWRRAALAGICIALGCRFDASATSGDGGSSLLGDGQADGISLVCFGESCKLVRRHLVQLREPLLAEPLMDVPVLVILDGARITYDRAAPGGEDLRFFAADDRTPLDHEIARWDPSGRSYVWVRALRLSANERSFFLYYGDRSLPGGEQAQGVYRDGFHAVWHLDADDLRDSSASAHAAVDQGSSSAPGALLGGRAFNGRDQFIDTGCAHNLLEYTIEAWVKGEMAPILGGRGPNGPLHRDRNYQLNWDHTDQVFLGSSALHTDDWYAASFGGLEAGRFYYMVSTYDGQTLKSYLDGALISMNETPAGPPTMESATAKIARHAAQDSRGNHFEGIVDEVRLSTATRSPAWIELQHRSMTDQLLEYGPGEDVYR